MIRKFVASNYKSIDRVELDLGRVNVIVGENGAGKSNILEALALAGAAQADRLDNEFLVNRGIRVTEPQLMRAAFDGAGNEQPISLEVHSDEGVDWVVRLSHDNKPYSSWSRSVDYAPGPSTPDEFKRIVDIYMASDADVADKARFVEDLLKEFQSKIKLFEHQAGADTGEALMSFNLSMPVTSDLRYPLGGALELGSFMVYTPENSALREFSRVGQVEPLGPRGEGLFKLLAVMQEEHESSFAAIGELLALLGWFKQMTLDRKTRPQRLMLQDYYFATDAQGFDQRSVNEGFLFLAFYFALFISKATPSFFAIDNVDTSLNPRLCEELTRTLVRLAFEHDKQVILTTHNPSILDGLDLKDEEQRLFVVDRDDEGRTRVDRVRQKVETARQSRISEQFMKGLIGGLPKAF